jgi:hypothetical protein
MGLLAVRIWRAATQPTSQSVPLDLASTGEPSSVPA